MKTILDYGEFRQIFKTECFAIGLRLFYYKCVIANFFSFLKKPTVYLRAYRGDDRSDEVYDSIHNSLVRCGLKWKTNFKISPYDVVAMSAVTKHVVENDIGYRKCVGLKVTFKNFNEVTDKFGGVV